MSLAETIPKTMPDTMVRTIALHHRSKLAFVNAIIKRRLSQHDRQSSRPFTYSYGTQMPNTSIDILSNFKLNHWYKLAIYLGAILIILNFVFVNNSNVEKYTSFAVVSLVLGLMVWMIEDTLIFYWGIKEEEERYDKLKIAKNLAPVVFAVRWIGLFIWIAIILTYI